MNRPLAGLCAILALSLPSALAAQETDADDEAAFYYELYKYSTDYGEKAAFLTVMGDAGDESAVTSFDEALTSLLSVDRSTLSAGNAEDYDKAIRVTCSNLGRYAYSPAALNLMRVFRSRADALARSEALIAIGRIGTREYIDEIVSFLDGLNLEPTRDPDAGEKLAYGAIVCLSLLEDPRGWRPIFFASQGWYSQWVRTEAEAGLTQLRGDPSKEVIEIISGSHEVRYKLAALKLFSSTASAPLDKRLYAAREALKQGLAVQVNTVMQKQSYLELRLAALNQLVALGDKGEDIIPSLETAWDRGNLDERLLIASFLGLNASKAGLALLSKTLMNVNTTRKSGLTGEDQDRIAKALIQAAGKSKNSSMIPALEAVVGNAQWTSSVIQAAREALSQVKGG